MRIIFCFGLLLTVCLTFKISSFDKENSVFELVKSVGCSDARVKIVNASITQCESFGITLSTECIKNYLLNQTNGEKWDVLAEIPDKSDARITYWSYDDCAVRYERYGQLKITYTIWKATLSNQSFVKEVTKQFLMGDNSQQSQSNEVCSDSRVKLARDSITICQNNDPSLQAACIRNNIKSKSGQKWNALVASDDKTQYFSVRYNYFDGCIVQSKSFGIRKRNYLLWKAE